MKLQALTILAISLLSTRHWLPTAESGKLSALYRFPNKIDTITRAIQVVGTRSTYDLALAYGVSQAFSEVNGQAIDLDKFWEQSVSCGLLAKYFADMRNIREPERLFVSGLLHNIGELVTVSLLPESATRCQAFNAQVSPAELQFGVLGFTYAELSARLMKNGISLVQFIRLLPVFTKAKT